jgi:hypothetical protein
VFSQLIDYARLGCLESTKDYPYVFIAKLCACLLVDTFSSLVVSYESRMAVLDEVLVINAGSFERTAETPVAL